MALAAVWSPILVTGARARWPDASAVTRRPHWLTFARGGGARPAEERRQALHRLSMYANRSAPYTFLENTSSVLYMTFLGPYGRKMAAP
jgi:hypothetical protein